jgi:hypothetical protein
MTPSSEELLKAFPEWTAREEETWLELFREYSLLLMGARLDPEAPGKSGCPRSLEPYQVRLEDFKEDVLMASELADAALDEVWQRVQIQKEQTESQRKKARRAYQERRKTRQGSRK